jgi:hypothetical protein
MEVGISMTAFGSCGGVFSAHDTGAVGYSKDGVASNEVTALKFALSNLPGYPVAGEFRGASLAVGYYIAY